MDTEDAKAEPCVDHLPPVELSSVESKHAPRNLLVPPDSTPKGASNAEAEDDSKGYNPLNILVTPSGTPERAGARPQPREDQSKQTDVQSADGSPANDQFRLAVDVLYSNSDEPSILSQDDLEREMSQYSQSRISRRPSIRPTVEDTRDHKELATDTDQREVQIHSLEEYLREIREWIHVLEKDDLKKEVSGMALHCILPNNRVRVFLGSLVQATWFENVILVVIVANCAFLAIDDGSTSDSTQYFADIAFIIVFTTEMLLKIVAFGVYWTGDSAYLRDNWNVLDFFVVIVGFLGFLPGAGNFTVIRTFRLLRPLRAINKLPGMKVMVSSLLSSMASLTDMMALLMFLLCVFGIVGIQLYGGKLRQRCYDIGTGKLMDDSDRLCTLGAYGRSCPLTQFCAKSMHNPNYDVTSFDNILVAWLTIIQAFSLEGWVDIMYWVSEVAGAGHQLFFVVLILVGSLFIINLVVEVISVRFEESKEQDKRRNVQIQHLKYAEWTTEQKLKTLRAEANPQRRSVLTFAVEEDDDCTSAGGDSKSRDPTTSDLGISPALSRGGSTAAVDPRSIDPNTNTAMRSITMHRHFSSRNHVLLWGDLVEVGKLSSLQRYVAVPCQWLVHEPAFRVFIVLAVLVNTIMLSLEHDDMSDRFQHTLDVSNNVFTQIFAAEFVLKLIGLGVRGYFQDFFNQLDFCIVVLGELELVVASGTSLSVLRSLRLLRVFKVLRDWKALHRLLLVVMMSAKDVFYFSLLFFLFMFIYTILGMQLFRGKFDFAKDEVRSNFDSFWWSFLSVFQILTGEGWNELMYVGVRAVSWFASLYFVSLFILGSYMVLSLFLAILVGNFSASTEVDADKDHEEKERVKKRYSADMYLLFGWHRFERIHRPVPSSSQSPGSAPALQPAASMPTLAVHSRNHSQQGSLGALTAPPQSASQNLRSHSVLSLDSGLARQSAVTSTESINHEDGGRSSPLLRRRSIRNLLPTLPPLLHQFTRQSSFAFLDSRPNPFSSEKSLWIFGPDNALRKKLQYLVNHPWFNHLISFMIVASGVFLALDSPRADLQGANSDTNLAKVVAYGDVAVTAMFTLEMVCKVIAAGFLLHPNAYLRNGWNVLDFIIVMISLADLDGDLKFFRGFRALRALRPLRLMARVSGMRTVVRGIVSSLSTMFSLILVSSIFFLVFAILGVQLFKGGFKRCENVVTGEEFPSWSRSECIAQNGPSSSHYAWVNPDQGNFDNVGYALLTLFEVASLEMWPTIMHRGIDSTPSGEAPDPNNQPWVALYFVLFICVCNFFVLSLFVGVVVDEYRDESSSQHNSSLTSQQKQYLRLYRTLLSMTLDNPIIPPSDPFITNFGRKVRRNVSRVCSRVRSICIRPSPARATPSIELQPVPVAPTQFAGAEVFPHPIRKTGRSQSVVLTGRPSVTLDLPSLDEEPVSAPMPTSTSPKRHQRSHSFSRGADSSLEPQSTKTSPPRPLFEAKGLFSVSTKPVAQDDEKAQVQTKPAASKSPLTVTPTRRPLPAPVALPPELSQSSTAPLNSSAMLSSTSSPTSPTSAASPMSRAEKRAILLFASNARTMGRLRARRERARGSIIGNPEALERKITTILVDDLQRAETVSDLIENQNNPLELRLRWKVLKFVSKDSFEIGIAFLILLNVIVMSMDYYEAPPSYVQVLDFLNAVFTWLFTIELILKWIGIGIVQYFREYWNCLDAFVVFVSILAEIMTVLGQATNIGVDVTVFRMLRIIRIFRLVNRSQGLKQMIEAIIRSLPSLKDIAMLLFLLLFVYSCIGMGLFGNVKHQEHINDHANFEDFPTAMLLLFRCSTGESWNGLMHDCSVEPPRCNPEQGNCGNSVYAKLFFISFVVLNAWLMLKLFVAVVFNSFEQSNVNINEVQNDHGDRPNESVAAILSQEQDDKVPVTKYHLEDLATLWAKFSSKPLMPITKLPDLLHELTGPLDVTDELDQRSRILECDAFISVLHELQVPQINEQILFHDLAVRLMTRAIDKYIRRNATKQVASGRRAKQNTTAALVSRIPNENATLRELRSIASKKYPEVLKTHKCEFTAAEVVAALVVQDAYRQARMRRVLKEFGDESKQA